MGGEGVRSSRSRGQVDISNVDQLRDRLLSVINRGATVLIADMTSTVSCDHAAVDAIAKSVPQRAAASGEPSSGWWSPLRWSGACSASKGWIA